MHFLVFWLRWLINKCVIICDTNCIFSLRNFLLALFFSSRHCCCLLGKTRVEEIIVRFTREKLQLVLVIVRVYE